jgi:hypothetical protein
MHESLVQVGDVVWLLVALLATHAMHDGRFNDRLELELGCHGARRVAWDGL